LKKEVKKNI